MLQRIINTRIVKYLIVGILTVGIDYVTMYTLYQGFAMNYMIAVSFGFLLSNIFQFYMNFFYTFSIKEKKLLIIKMFVFWIAVIIGNSLALGLIVILKSYITNLLVVKTLSLPLSFLYGYFVSKHIIYNTDFYRYLASKSIIPQKYFQI